VYSGKDGELSLPVTIATDATVTTLTTKTKNVCNKLYMDKTSPDLFDVLRQQTVVGPLGQDRKVMFKITGQKFRLKWDDTENTLMEYLDA
jgi:hypothetical protein